MKNKRKEFTQRDYLLILFRDKTWVTVQEMNQIAFRYGAILFNLRKDGYDFEKRRQAKYPNLEEWRLIK